MACCDSGKQMTDRFLVSQGIELVVSRIGSYTIYNRLSNILIIIMNYIRYQRLMSIIFMLHVKKLSHTKNVHTK